MADIFETKTDGENTEQSILDELVGEGKKFKTVEDLAKGKLESDAFIEQLEGENKTVREKLAELEGASGESATVADLIKAVRDADAKSGETSEVTNLTDEELAEKVRSIMHGESEAQTRARNREQANQSVLEKVGGDEVAAKTYLEERARQLGLTVAALGELGERSPTAFAELMNSKLPVNAPSVSSIRGQNTQTEARNAEVIDGHHTKAYYDRLKKEIGPAKFWNDPKIQGAYYKDALALGDRFKSN